MERGQRGTRGVRPEERKTGNEHKIEGERRIGEIRKREMIDYRISDAVST